jgi:ribosomal protein S18 acetylase RimI-like enzyme
MRARPMLEEECEAVAAMVHGLARDTGAGLVPAVDAAALRANACGSAPLIDVVVAEIDGRLAGACLGLITFSTWRGVRGLYVVDLFVEPAQRGRGVGESLLREATRRAAAKGARFVKLEVDSANSGAARFYDRLDFSRKDGDRLFILETREFSAFIGADWLGD